MKTAIQRLSGVLILAAFVIGMPAKAEEDGVKRSTGTYVIPQVQMVRDDGTRVLLRDEFKDGKPVVVTFIFTTCTTICPLISQTLVKLQEKLGPEKNRVHIASISIDPEEDTPSRLTAYAKELHAGPEWRHYTGTMQSIITTARAFNVYRGDKMAHAPVIFVRPAPEKPWVRFDGFVTAGQLLSEIQPQIAAAR
jgi:protein SCO1